MWSISRALGAALAVSGCAAWLGTGVMKPVIADILGDGGLATVAMAGTLCGAALVAGALCGVVIYLLAFLPIHDKPNFQVRALIVTLGGNDLLRALPPEVSRANLEGILQKAEARPAFVCSRCRREKGSRGQRNTRGGKREGSPVGSFCRLPVPGSNTAAAEARARFWFLVVAGMTERKIV